jgi:hypothetical protein
LRETVRVPTPYIPARPEPADRLHPEGTGTRAERNSAVKNIEDGLNVHHGHAYGPLAEAALRRAANGRRRLDRLQHEAFALSDGQVRYEVYRIIRYVTQGAPSANQVFSLAREIRCGTRLDLTVTDRLPSA